MNEQPTQSAPAVPENFVIQHSLLGSVQVGSVTYQAGADGLVLRNPAAYGLNIPGAEPDYDWEYEVVSVCVPGLQPGEIGIKNYSEHAGMLDFLRQHGVVEPPHRHVESGFVTIPVTRLSPAWAGIPPLR